MILAGSHLCPTRSQCLAYKQFLRQKLLIQILKSFYIAKDGTLRYILYLIIALYAIILHNNLE